MSMRRRIAPLLIALSLMAGGAVLGSRVGLDNDISRLLPDSTPELQRATTALARLMDRSLVDIGSPDGRVSLQELGRIADDFARELSATDYTKSVRARMDASEALPVVELLRDRAALLLDERSLDELPTSIEPDRAIATIQLLAQRLQEPDGAYLKSTAAVDPLGLTNPALAPLQAFAEGLGDVRLIDGRITSADGQHVLVLVEVEFPATDIDQSGDYLTELEQIVTTLQADPENRGVQIRHVGAHRATLDNVDQIKRDVVVTSAVGVSFVALLAILCLGRIWLALLALTPALCGGVLAWGVFSLFKDSMSGAVLGFGAVLLGLTIDFAIHVLFRIDRAKEGEPVQLPVRALYMGGTTTSLAFVALQASSLPAVRDIGLFGAVGVFVAVLFALYVLPSLVVGRRKSRPVVDLQEVVSHLAKPAMPAVIVALLATPVFAIGLCFLEFDGDPTNLNGMSPEGELDRQAIESTWGQAAQTTSLIVEGEDIPTALEANDALARWLDERQAEGEIREHGSIAGLLPAPETQRRRLRAWREFWSTERLAALTSTLQAATDRSPFAEGAFEPFQTWVQTDPDIISYDAAVSGPLEPFLRGRIFAENGLWRVITPVFTQDWEQTEALDIRLAQEMPGVTLLNRQAFSRKLADMVTGEVGVLALLAFMLVTSVVFAWHGRPLITIVMVLPLLLSLLWTLGLLGWFGVPISLANAIFVVFLFGVAVDYSIFLASSRLDRFRTGEDRTKEAQASVLLCTLTTCGGFGSLTMAGHPVMHSIGLTALIGIFSAALTTQIFVPAMTGLLLRRGGPNGTPGLGNLWGGLRCLWTLGGGGLRHLLTRGFSRGAEPVVRERAAIDSIRRMSDWVVKRTPCGRRRYLDLDKLSDEPCVFVANHESMFDIVAILALPHPIQVLVKGWVWDAPVMGAMVQAAGYVPVTDSSAEEIFATVEDRFRRGNSLLIFPESRRTRTGKMGRFHNGAFAMARRLGTVVQPIAMVNTREVAPPLTWWIGDHDCIIAALDPMDPTDFQGEGGDRRMAKAARDRIKERCAELWLETQVAPTWPKTVGGMYRYLGPLITHYSVSKCKRDPLIAELPELCPGKGRILVAGSGFGLMTARLALAYPERPITCLDLDAQKLQLSRAALGDRFPVDFVASDLRDAELPQANTVLLIDVLHYWDAETQSTILRRLAAAVPPGGTLLFRDGCAGDGQRNRWVFAQEWLATRTGFTESHGGFLFRSADGWKALLEREGFEVQDTRPDLGQFSNLVLVCRRK